MHRERLRVKLVVGATPGLCLQAQGCIDHRTYVRSVCGSVRHLAKFPTLWKTHAHHLSPLLSSITAFFSTHTGGPDEREFAPRRNGRACCGRRRPAKQGGGSAGSASVSLRPARGRPLVLRHLVSPRWSPLCAQGTWDPTLTHTWEAGAKQGRW